MAEGAERVRGLWEVEMFARQLHSTMSVPERLPGTSLTIPVQYRYSTVGCVSRLPPVSFYRYSTVPVQY